MAKVGPFKNLAEAIEMSRQIWWNQVDVPGWLEAFGAHPRIGALSSKSTTDWCAEEQATALSSANDRALKDLAEWNWLYESKFGFVFLVCATGKSSSEILQLLKGRITNRPLVELQVAANEQQKTTELRLSKLVSQNTAPGGDENTSKLSLSEQRLDHEKPLGSPLSHEESGEVSSLAHVKYPIYKMGEDFELYLEIFECAAHNNKVAGREIMHGSGRGSTMTFYGPSEWS
ncbi:uric acid degradation bifunctional protein TTL [Selaginella moellendorffii]|uniref:uric acid degradation bifunctional protein TTL n=1 Tax=Selaginella moellendorffii TaxID=88036 RepID=UPI000D1C792A|nr:uric acid degradation bifunctional protein TTL [Selaginella moellendorffii]|eukprot:XP_002980815.2 uric acid degradation bifunctional protein TTL [Selaginella moellendorffii]